MKKSILYLTLLLFIPIRGHSQEVLTNNGSSTPESIQQIHLPGIEDILNLQTFSQEVTNYTVIQQTGNHNTATINQQNNSGSEKSNQSFTTQSGNSNELTIGQIGSGNILLGFQLGYLAALSGANSQANQGTGTNGAGITTNLNGNIIEGDHNQMNITQNGNNNVVMAVQEGSGNTISAEQNKDNNYLIALQKGTNNSLTGYKQENESGLMLLDRVIQVGDNLTLKSDEVSKSSVAGNTFIQTGANLSLEINSDLLNSAGGIEINQTGKDMKVVIDQSYFSFPLK